MPPLVLDMLLALALDFLIGDPQWRAHPVRLIGRMASVVERSSRRHIANERWAGILTWFAVIFLTLSTAWGALYLAGLIHPLIAHILSIGLIYSSIAPRDLAKHALSVKRALDEGDLRKARQRVGLMVSRDSDRLDEQAVTRATVESVAENIVDGVTAPLLWGAVLGPLGAILYRAVNTLDAMFGYKNHRYLRFGWLSAKTDDAVNWLPARFTALLVCVASSLAGGNPLRGLKIMKRDGGKHASPNAGYCESALAGALNIRLGGPGRYFGKTMDKPFLGDGGEELHTKHIQKAVFIMLATTMLITAISVAVILLVFAAKRGVDPHQMKG